MNHKDCLSLLYGHYHHGGSAWYSYRLERMIVPTGRVSIKILPCQYLGSYCIDLYHENPYIWKDSLYWDGPTFMFPWLQTAWWWWRWWWVEGWVGVWWCFPLVGEGREATYHYSDIIISATASQITSILIVCSTVCSGADQRKHQSSASLAFVRRIQRRPVESPNKGPVTRIMFPFDDVIMRYRSYRPVPKHYRTQTRTLCGQFVGYTEHDYFTLQLNHSVDVLVKTHVDKTWIITVLFFMFVRHPKF